MRAEDIGTERLRRIMRLGLSRKNTAKLIAGLMLAFAVRALIPQGFMPAAAAPLTLQLCPEGLPAQLLAHLGHHHPGGHSHNEHCVFGSAGGCGPLAQLASLGPIWLGAPASPARLGSALILVRLVHLPQVRGPPATS